MPGSRKTLEATATTLAKRLGHHLTSWVPEEGLTRTAALSFCLTCGLFAGYDGSFREDQEEESIYGSATAVLCQGPGTPPAWSTARAKAIIDV